MIDSEIGQQYLDQFDTLDLSEKPQRRVGVYVLKEFYSTVMADVGREYLGIENEIKRFSINKQWGWILARIESLEGFSKPDDSDKIIFTLKEERKETHHNTAHDPPKRQLEELRESAPTWGDWLLNHGRKYYEYEEELDPHGTIVEMAKTTLQETKSKRKDLVKRHKVEDTAKEINYLINKLNELEDEHDEITTELVNILKEALTLREEMKKAHERERNAIMDFISEHPPPEEGLDISQQRERHKKLIDHL